MRSPSDFITLGILAAFMGVIPLGMGVVIGEGWQLPGLVAAIACWVVGSLLLQVGLIGAGVKLGLRARADERAREARPKSKPPKLNTAGQVAVAKVRGARKVLSVVGAEV